MKIHFSLILGELIYLLKDLNYEKTTRKTFARIGDFIDIPNLIQVQKDSYDWFVKEGLRRSIKRYFTNH